MPWSKDAFMISVRVGKRRSIQSFHNEVGIGSRTQLLLLDDRMIVLRPFGSTWSNWLKDAEHDTLVTPLDRGQDCWVRARLISMILDSEKSPKLSARCSRESCVGRVGENFTLNIPSTSLKSCLVLMNILIKWYTLLLLESVIRYFIGFPNGYTWWGIHPAIGSWLKFDKET